MSQPKTETTKISDLLICTDPASKEVHIRDADDPYYGTTIKTEEALENLIITLKKALRTVFPRKVGR